MLKHKLMVYLNKSLILYEMLVNLLIGIEDKQRRISQYKREYGQRKESLLWLYAIADKINLTFAKTKFSLSEQIDLVGQLRLSDRYKNSVQQPFEQMSKRRDLRLYVRRQCSEIYEALSLKPLHEVLKGRGVLDEEYVTRIEVAQRSTGDFEKTYTSILESLEDKRKRRSAYIILLIEPILTVLVGLGVEAYIALSIVPDMLMGVEDGNYPPIINSYMVLNNILLHQKVEYAIKLTILTIILYFFFKLKATKLLFHMIVLQIPILQKYLARWEVSKFFDSVYAMIEAGSSLPQAVEVSIDLISNQAIKRSLEVDLQRLGSSTSDLGELLKNSVYVEHNVRNQLKSIVETGGESSEILPMIVEEYKQHVKVLVESPQKLIIPMMLAAGGLYVFGRIMPLYLEISSITEALL